MGRHAPPRQNHQDRAAEILRIPFALTRTVRAASGSIHRLRCAEHEGARSWSFDLSIDFRDVGPNESIATNYSAAIVQLPWRLDGRIGLARRGFMRTPQPLDASELNVGTEELRRRFAVRGTSTELAARLLDDRVCDWLSGAGRRCHYEIVHDRVLAYSWRRYLGGGGPLRAALGLAAQLSR